MTFSRCFDCVSDVLRSGITFSVASLIGLFVVPTFGQPLQDRERLYETTEQRSVEELIKALSTRDGTNYDYVMAATVNGGSLGELVCLPRGLMSDPRVQKIYRELKRMPGDKASRLVVDHFNAKLADFKSKGQSRVTLYGLHATLFLVSQFADKEAFIQCFDDWFQWSRKRSNEFFEKVRKKKREAKKQGEEYRWYSESDYKFFVPELIASLNFFIGFQLRQGETIESISADLEKAFAYAGDRLTLENPRLTAEGIAQTLKRSKFEWRDDSDRLGHVVSDERSDGELVAEFYGFKNWVGHTAFWGYEERMLLLQMARGMISPPTLSERTEMELIRLGVEARRKKEAEEDQARERMQQEAMRALNKGARLRKMAIGLGPSGRRESVWTVKTWKPGELPDKKEFKKVLDEMYLGVPQRYRERQHGPAYKAALEWLESLGDRGLAVSEYQKYRWPENAGLQVPTVAKEGAQDGVGESKVKPKTAKFWFDFEVVSGDLLQGPMPATEDGPTDRKTNSGKEPYSDKKD